MDKALMHTAYFDRMPGNIHGVLTLQYVTSLGFIKKVFDKLAVSSGQRGYEDGNWTQGKSPTPYGAYWLSTKYEPLQFEPKGSPFHVLSSVPGSRIIKGPDGKQRENAGVHLENKYEGTIGCTALLNDTVERACLADAFFAYLDALNEAGVKHIRYVVL